jgi:DNA-binding GntR family transcriptional regulator
VGARATSSNGKKQGAQPRPVRGAGVQMVYEQLRLAIVNLDLTPGSPLDEVRLSQKFALSRTPVREALVRLAGDGLVTMLPNRSTVVSPIDFGKLPVYFEALTLMYRVTTRAAALRRRDADLVAMREAQAEYVDAVGRSDAVGMISTNREFHLAIAEAGDNAYFTNWFSRLLDEGRRLLRLYYYASFDDHLPRRYVDEHEAMIQAIEERDAERCDELAAQHAAQIVRQIQSYMTRDVTAQMRLDTPLGRAERKERA